MRSAAIAILRRDQAYPVLVISAASVSLITSFLAGYGADTLAPHAWPLRIFMFTMMGLALRDLLHGKTEYRKGQDR